MTITTALLLSALAAEAAPPLAPSNPATGAATPSPSSAPAKAPTSAKRATRRPGAPVASLPTVEGELLEVDHRAHRLRVRTASGELVLTFDRNTIVLAPGGGATPIQLTAGAIVRAGREGEARAAWVELKAPPSSPAAGP